MQKSSRFFAVAFLPILMLFLVPSNIQPAYAIDLGDVDVRVTIKELRSLDVIDTLDGADFFPEVRIDGANFGGESYEIVDDDNPSPDWQFTKKVDFSQENINIRISIFDYDTFANGGNDHIDLQPGHPDRNLDLTLNLDTCSISLDISNDCFTDIVVSGSANDSAEMRFSIEILDPDSGSGLQIYCLHSPIWPQQDEDITIRAFALNDNLKPQMVEKIEIMTSVDPNPVSTKTNNYHTTATVDPSVVDFMYECNVTNDGSDATTGWRELDVDTETGKRAISILSVAELQDAKDITFWPEENFYASADDLVFLQDVEKAIDTYYLHALIFLENQDAVNFWLSQDKGSADGKTPSGCDNFALGQWQMNFAYSDANVILHRDANIRDCAGVFVSADISSANPAVLVHELGHRPFGLADEYCKDRPGSMSSKCDGGYRQIAEAPNVFDNKPDCDFDNPDPVGNPCQEWISEASSTLGDHFFTFDPVKDDFMVDNTEPRYLDLRRINHVFDTFCAMGLC